MQFTGITTSAAKLPVPDSEAGDWERFQRLIRETEDGSEKSEYNPGIYRVTDPALNIRTGPGEYPVVESSKTRKLYDHRNQKQKLGQTAVGSGMDQLP